MNKVFQFPKITKSEGENLQHISETISNLELEKIAEEGMKKNEKRLQTYKKAILAQYPVKTDDEILDIVFALENQKECEKCQAEGCQLCIHYNEQEYTINADGTVTSRLCEKKARQYHENKCEIANIPPRYRHLTFDDYELDEYNLRAVKQARQAINQKLGLFIHGNCGTGKTFLASIIAQELIRAGKSVYFTSVSEIFYKLETLSNEETAQFLRKLERAKLLIIDDLGAESPTARLESLVFMLVNQRYNVNYPVIVTTNLKTKEEPKTDAMRRIFSRLKGTCIEVELEGTDRRTTIIQNE